MGLPDISFLLRKGQETHYSGWVGVGQEVNDTVDDQNSVLVFRFG